MRFFNCLVLVVPMVCAFTQNTLKQLARTEPKSATVPFILDHDHVIIKVDLPLPDGSTQSVRALLDSGNPRLFLSQRVAKLMGLSLICAGQVCASPTTPTDIMIGGMKVPLSNVKPTIREKTAEAESVMLPGVNAEMNLPSPVLRNYDVLIDFPEHQFAIAWPGILKFDGMKTKTIVDAENGTVQIPSRIDNKKFNLGLDLGSSISFLSTGLFDILALAHPDWPRMTGAVGPANMSGSNDEPNCKLMRMDRLQYGPLFLTDVVVAESAKDATPSEKQADTGVAGVLGSEALLNYRIGLDYKHSAVYFEIGRTFKIPDFDVIGVILRPEDDGRFTIIGIADYDGKPSVPAGENGVQSGDRLVAVDNIAVRGSTLGQVWSMLGGTPGQNRVLAIERNGKQFAVTAKVSHFLEEAGEHRSENQN
jgi:hypothetical protein